MNHLRQYLEYIKNTGSPTIEQFDDDWDPIGPMLRADMLKYRMIVIEDGKIYDAALTRITMQEKKNG